MYHEGYLHKHIWEVLDKPLIKRPDSLSSAFTNTLHEHPEVKADKLESAIKIILESQINSLHDMLPKKYSETIFSVLVNEVDSASTDLQGDLVDWLHHKKSKEIATLMTIIISESEVENISLKLGEEG